MADYDLDRIAALAAGTLDSAEAAVLEAQIAADPRAAAELAAQRRALQAIAAAPAPSLSPTERGDLHASVAAALHLERWPRPAPVPPKHHIPWRALALAAGLAAIIAAVPIIGLRSVGGGGEAATTVALATSTAAAAPRQTAPASTTNAPAGTGDLATLGAEADQMFAFTDADQAADSLFAAPQPLFAPAPEQAAHPNEASPCADAAEDALGSGAQVGPLLEINAGEAVVWFVSADGLTVERLLILDTATCSTLAARP
jgi:hypothetical protein